MTPHDRPLRVLRVITTIEPEVGGPSYSAVNAAVAERSAAIQTTLLSTTEAGADPYSPAALGDAGVVHKTFVRPRCLGELAKRWGLSAGLAREVFREARRHDIVHVHYVWSLGTLAGVIAGALWRRPVVMTPHESLTSFDIGRSRTSMRRQQKLLVRRLLLAGVSHVVTASNLELRDSGLDDSGRVVHHPVPETTTATFAEPYRDPGPLRVGFLGRLHPKKRLSELISAVVATAGETVLRVGGAEPPEVFRAHQARIVAEGLTDRVQFLGFVAAEDRDAFFADIDVLAMPSSYECFGMVAAEALSTGTPVVVTDSTGIAEVVRRSGAGTIISVSDPDALQRALLDLATRPEILARQQAAARDAARDHLSFSAYAASIRAVYDEALTARRRRPRER